MAKPKFDYYSDPKFYQIIEDYAQKGLTDKNIAWALVKEYGDNLSPQYFSELKNEKDKNGELTERAKNISEALARGRDKINMVVRDTYLKSALGGKKVKTVVKRYVETSCPCDGQNENCTECGGTGRIFSSNKAVMQESEIELAPNIQALGTWLFNHDDEWRQKTIEGKKLDITTKGEEINKGFTIEIIDKREQVEDTNDESI